MSEEYDDIEHQPPPPGGADHIGKAESRKESDPLYSSTETNSKLDESYIDSLRKTFGNKSIKGHADSISGSLGSSSVPVSSSESLTGVTLCVLFMELCERLAYYSVAGNLLLFCVDNLDLGSSLSSTIVLAFSGVSYFLPLFGGWIADSLLGKYNTIYSSGLLYFVGAALLPFVALPSSDLADHLKLDETSRRVYFAIALLFISIGTGGIKSNVSPFGAEQVQRKGPQAIRRFFIWFYWFINIGSFLAFTAVVYVQTNINFFYGFLIPAGAVLLSIIIFSIGRNKYICQPPNGSVLTDLCKIAYRAIRCRFHHRNPNISLLDHARMRYGSVYSDAQVDTLVALLRIMPVYLCIIFYWTIYFQMQSSYLLQGLNMNLKLGNIKIPPASLNVFDVIVILLLIPFVDRVVYPLANKVGLNLTQLRRMGIGMILSMFSVIVAGLVEYYRREHVDYTIQNTFSGNVYNASTVSVFLQAPQFLLIGSGEVFTSITGLEFAYSQSPRLLQGVVMGLFLVTSGLGAFVGSALVNLVKYSSMKYSSENWYPDDINNGRLDYYFYLLAIIMFVNFIVFCFVASKYKYVQVYEPLKEGSDQISDRDIDKLRASPRFI